MLPILLAEIAQIWYALPLVVVVSLVYAATRHELMPPILHRALRTAVWIAGFMGIVFGILYLVDQQL
jgi:uncharacterized membrane protein